MTGLWRSIKNEWTKMTSMTKFRLLPILFVGLIIAAAAVGSIPGSVIRLTMANFPYTVLSWLGYVIAPITAFMLTSDLLAGEIETGQIRILLGRPLTRIKILLAKLFSIIGYLAALYLLGFVVSSVISIATAGFSAFSIVSAVGAYIVGLLPVLALTAMAVMVAATVKSSTTSFALCLALYLGALLAGWVFSGLSPILFTSYMGIGGMISGASVPVASLLTGIGILLGYTAVFLSVSSLRFENKEL